MSDLHPERRGEREPGADTRVSRATLLRGTAAAAIAAMAVPDLSLGAARATPKRGGTLRAGFVGGGTAETINPYLGVTPIDEARIQNLYDPLVITNADLTRSPGLALEFNHNKDATVYEVKLRPGVTFHNGKTFGAEDVIWSIRQMAGKTSAGLPFVSGIKLAEMKAVDKLTVRIPLKAPDADLAGNFTYYNTWIVPSGQTAKDYKKPVGSGPFMAKSFTPGRQSEFVKNPNYWVSGKPYVDSLKIVAIDDNNARLNALLSKQIDAMAQLPTQQAKAHSATGDITVLAAPSPQAMMFYMDTTKAPFSDPRVTLAMKLIADRQALVDSAISGYGKVGNDIFGAGLPFYDAALPQRVQDIGKAKSLLKAAGHSDLTVQLNTSPIFPGFVEAATLLQQQAKKAGVTINLKQVPPNSYYNPSLLYLKMPFAETQWPIASLKFFFLQALVEDAPYNETHWHSKEWNALLKQAIGEPNHAKAQSLWNQVQKIQYEKGGYLNWTNADWVDGLSKNVQGIKPSAAGVLGNYR
ncbi:MAG: peptide/nickel transport system substrate-binding protein, partial [Gaiellales bacterium]|nr:peptide/nickel transport system substrate-binding protein [Gaiellales bacterium]